MVVMGIFLIGTVLWVGTLYWKLHSLPERMAHKSQKLQFEIVAVLGLISLFTHMHIFWVAGLLLAMIDLPDFGTPLRSIADSVEKIADRRRRAGDAAREAEPRRRRPSPPQPTTEPRARGRSAAMFELMFCSLFTIVPDYLYRRYAQGKRFGKEITFFSVWYELRWGITGCLMLTVSLITMIFYFHPSTTSAALYFRTVPILPEGSGRVAEVKVGFSAPVKKGDVLFTLDSSKQQAAFETARRKIAEVEPLMSARRPTWSRRKPRSRRRRATFSRPRTSWTSRRELQRRNPGIVPQRDIEKLQVLVDQRQAGVDAATAVQAIGVHCSVSTLLPAEKASAEAALAQAQVDLDKTFVRAGVDGRVEQFLVRTGDVVNQMMRPAGVLIPEGAGQGQAAGRLRPDRGPGDEAGHGRGSDLHLEAMDDHSDGGHQRAGLHRRRPVPRPASS